LSALATAPLDLFPVAPPARGEGRLTLEQRLDRDLGAALAGRVAACPACGGPMRRAAEAEARCGDCGTKLS
jgi:tRNA(Ile2) C34 agmatinyltransferase TiaS